MYHQGKSDDNLTHKSAISGSLVTPRINSTASSTSSTFLTIILSVVLLKSLLNLLLLIFFLAFVVTKMLAFSLNQLVLVNLLCVKSPEMFVTLILNVTVALFLSVKNIIMQIML